MVVRTYLAIFAVISVLFGISFVLAPGPVLSIYGIRTAPDVELTARLYGGTLLAIAVIQWSAREFPEAAVRAVLIALGVASVINLVVLAMASLAGTINAMGWSAVLIYLCAGVGAGYFLTAGQSRQRAT
jgi:hypothetical protein